jgi:DNA mismatch repair protein MSH5
VYDSCGVIAENRIASYINFENVQMVRATGALLNHLLTGGMGNDDVVQTLEADMSGNAKIRLQSIETLQLENYMQIDSVTFNALQIFNLETHPSAISKVSLSMSVTVSL